MPEERKLVTILFADVTGSTALGDSLDPEDVRALMGNYYAHARSIISGYGGTLEKFIGDAVMAVFGLPQAHGDDAERALAAALALREAVMNDDTLGPSFMLRLGINTGEVIATSDSSSGDFLVTGDAVNVAARLQQNASPGEIIASERTMNFAQQAFLFDDVRLIQVKGKREPLRVFPLKSKRPARLVEHPPLIGRRQDLLQLALLQERVLEEQRPQLVSIVAPAGTGKTRLLEEFLSRLDAAAGFQVARVQCLPYSEGLIYWPLRGLLAGLLGAEITHERVVDAFAGGGYKMEDAARLADLVLATLGIKSEDESAVDRESIFIAWRLLIEALAQREPRIIVFEDLHWASDSLLDLVEQITHVRTQAAMLLIALSRPELLDRRPAWGGGRQNFTALALQPLTPGQTRDLVKRLVKDIPEATRESIVERCGGNPFFALELIRGLSAHGRLDASAPLDLLPDTVHAAVLARIDLLSKTERVVLQSVSVVSQPFDSSLLADVLGEYSLQEIENALDGLLARDMLVQGEGATLSFRHALIRDVAYGTLSRAERMRLHGKIALALENVAGDQLDEYMELIASHYREAVQLARRSAVRPQLPFETTRAIRFLQQAGVLAGRTGAFADAQAYLQCAIAIAPEAEMVTLYELLGDNVGWTISAIDAYQKALEQWRKDGASQPLTGARLLRKLLIHYTRGGRMDFLGREHIPAWRAEAQRLAEQAGDEDELWRIRMVDLFFPKVITDLSVEEKGERRRIGLAAAAYFERKGDWIACSEALDGYGAFSAKMGNFAEELSANQRRLTLPGLSALELGDAIHMMVNAYSNLGDYDRCIETIERALQDLRPGQPIMHLDAALSDVIRAAFNCGRWSVIDALIPRLEEMREQALYDPMVGFNVFDSYIGVLLLALAREDRRLINVASGVLRSLLASAPDTMRMSNLRILLDALLTDDERQLPALLAKLSGDLTGAVVFTLQLYDEHGLPVSQELIAGARRDPYYLNAMSLHCIEIARALADGDNDALARTIDAAETHGLIVHAARMRIVLAQRTGNRTQLERARPVLERLGDRRFLHRLENVAISL
jgi:class 3 adenylate cyclase/tetratricopeptide (TPR) repeat protein